jgi:hypothetical protein
MRTLDLPIIIPNRRYLWEKGGESSLRIDLDGVTMTTPPRWYHIKSWHLEWNEIQFIRWYGAGVIRPLGLALTMTPAAIIARADKSRPYTNPTFKIVLNRWSRPIREIAKNIDMAYQAQTGNSSILQI